MSDMRVVVTQAGSDGFEEDGTVWLEVQDGKGKTIVSLDVALDWRYRDNDRVEFYAVRVDAAQRSTLTTLGSFDSSLEALEPA